MTEYGEDVERPQNSQREQQRQNNAGEEDKDKRNGREASTGLPMVKRKRLDIRVDNGWPDNSRQPEGMKAAELSDDQNNDEARLEQSRRTSVRIEAASHKVMVIERD